MIDVDHSSRGLGQPVDLDAFIRQHGAWHVIVRALRAMLRGRQNTAPPRARRSEVDVLSEHMRRDIGLLPAPPDPLTLRQSIHPAVELGGTLDRRRPWQLR